MAIGFDGTDYVVFEKKTGRPVKRFTTQAAALAYIRSES